VDGDVRHAQFAESLRIIREVWAGRGRGAGGAGRYGTLLPCARADLLTRSWCAANSLEAAAIAGRGGHNMMFSFLRTPEQYERLFAAYRGAGGRGSVAANRPLYLGEDDAAAWEEAEPALRVLWRRFVQEGRIPADRPEPERFTLENAPGQFVVGGPETVVRFVRGLRRRVPFDTFNVEPRWEGLPPERVRRCLERFAEQVMPVLREE
jgi:alkanesulfonate monooxygenase SsuD/methylene tetrahydromethanopterin reductase-like flavin-dependent oxidoreductase (luciferase family)